MKTHLFLVRHGETDYNKAGIVQGRGVDIDLNDTGRAQAVALAERFASESIDAVCGSPLRRARQTAAAVAERCGRPILPPDPDLEEMSWGILEGEPLSEEVLAAFAEMKTEWSQGNFDFGVEGGESVNTVARRGLAAVERIIAAEAGKRVVVIAHGRFLRIILGALLEEYGLERMEELGHANTCVNHLIHDSETGRYEARLLNCTAHLAGLEGDGGSAVGGL